MAGIRTSILSKHLEHTAPYIRPNDEESQTYGPHYWYIMDPAFWNGELPSVLVYNKTRQEFEKAPGIKGLSGINDNQPLIEFLNDVRNISRHYGPQIGATYSLETIVETTAQGLERGLDNAIEFLYFKVPFGYRIPFIDRFV